MLLNPHKNGNVFGLYLKLSAWLIPSFLVASLVGLHFLSAALVEDVENKLTARVGNLTARIASGLEALAEGIEPGSELNGVAAQQVLLTLLADPAIACAEVQRPGLADALLRVPEGLGCHVSLAGRETVLPIYFDGDADLVVNWTDAEIAAARASQRETSAVILIFGLVLALVTNWIAFRVIIGQPLNDLIARNEKARLRAEHSALHDPLTGLANRLCMDEALTKSLCRSATSRGHVTILNLDLDGFKSINDTMGHAAGDKALQHVSEILTDVAQTGELAARMGGDEFVVLLRDDAPQSRAIEFSELVISRLSENLSIGGDLCTLGTSIGIASRGTRPGPGSFADYADELLQDADIALYCAKSGGRGHWVVCTDDMRDISSGRRALAREIERAVERDEFVVHYQPLFDGDGTFVTGVEALVRWNHPDRGLLMPASFVEIAKELNLVDRIDRIVLEQALRDIVTWDRVGAGIGRVSVNVSARRLNTPDLIEELRALKIPPARLVFEVLETVYLDQKSKHLSWNLAALDELGIDVEIDDFGSGQASISSIMAIRPVRLKLARDLVCGGEAVDRNAILEAIASLGRSLDIGLVAQGVETQDQVDAVVGMQFDMIQGFALAEPMSAAEVIQFMKRAAANPTEQAKRG